MTKLFHPRIGRIAVSMAAIPVLLVAAGCAASPQPEADAAPTPLTEPERTPSMATDTPVQETAAMPLLEIPILTDEGYRARISITEWSPPSAADDLCAPVGGLGDFAVQEVNISGTVTLSKTNGFAWDEALTFSAGGSWGQHRAGTGFIGVIVCGAPLPPNSEELANERIRLHVPPTAGPETPFNVRISYFSSISPNSPEGDFSALSMSSSGLTVWHVAECESLSTADFQFKLDSFGACQIAATQ